MASRWLSGILALASSAGWAFAQPSPPAPAGDEAAAPTAIPEAPLPSADSAATESRAWVRAEYLLWKLPKDTTPVLVGTIPNADAEISRALPPGTIRPLIGGPNSSGAFPFESGWRLQGGGWLDPDGRFGLEGGAFQLLPARRRLGFHPGDDPVVGPVFVDSTVNQAVLIMASIPGLRTGTVDIALDRSMWGAEMNARRRVGDGLLPVPLDLLIGFRYLQVDEGLEIAGASDAILNGHAPCG